MPFPWLLVAQIALTIGGIILNARNVEQGKLDDINVDTGSYGRDLPFVLGEQQITGQTIWIDQNKLIEVRKKKKSFFGLGGSSTTYKYFANVAIALTCTKVKLVKVWANDDLIVDLSATTSGGASNGIKYEFKDGSDTQTVSSIMANPSRYISGSGGGGLFGLFAGGFASLLFGSTTTTTNLVDSAGNTNHPAYNGIAYLVFDRLPLEKYGNQIPTIKAQVVAIEDPDIFATHRGMASGSWPTFDKYGRAWFNQGIGGTNRFAAVDIASNEIVVSIERQVTAGGHIYFDDVSNVIVTSGGIQDSRIHLADPVTGKRLAGSSSRSLSVSRFRYDNRGIATTRTGSTVDVFRVFGSEITNEIDAFTMSDVVGRSVTGTGTALYGSGHTLISYTDANGGPYIGIVVGALMVNEFKPSDFGFTSYDVAYWERADEFIVFGPGGGIARFTQAGELIEQSMVSLDGVNTQTSLYITRNNPERTVWFRGNGTYFEFDLLSMVKKREVSDGEIIGFSAGGGVNRGVVYDEASNALAIYVNWSSAWRLNVAYLDRPGDTVLTVRDCLETLTEQLQIPNSKIDASEANREIKGAIISGDNIRSSIEQLLSVTGYDLIEEDGKLKVLDRGRAPALIIERSTMGAGDGDQSQTYFLERTMSRESELPWKAELSFADYNGDFENNVAIAERPRDAVDTNKVLAIDAPFALTVDQAKSFVEKLLAAPWRERAQVSFQVPAMLYGRLSPGDVVTVPDGSDVLNVRVTRVSGVETLEIEGVIDDPTGLDISLSGTSRNVPGTSLTRLAGAATPLIIDSALPADNISHLDGYGMVAIGVPVDTEIGNRDYYRSTDGENYDYVNRSTGEPLVRTIGALGDVHNPALMDLGNTITIKSDDRLQSISLEDLRLYPFLNLAFVEAGSDWELLQFQSVTDNLDGTMTLSGLMRGRRGTEHLIAAHATNDRLVVMTDGYLRGGDVSELGVPSYFVSSATESDELSPTLHTPNLASLRPYSPVRLRGDNSSDDAVLSWARRTRVGAATLSGSDVLLSEHSEAYEIDIEDAANIVVRTLSSTSETVTYSTSNQIIDLGTEWVPFKWTVYQLSSNYGRGIGRSHFFLNQSNVFLAQVSQVSAEVVVGSIGAVEVTQVAAEALISNDAGPARVSQVSVEVITD